MQKAYVHLEKCQKSENITLLCLEVKKRKL